MSAAQSSKQRISFTDIERQRLRIQHQSLTGQTPHTLALWFEGEFGRKISTSSVYDILSHKYSYLDNTKATDTRKNRAAQWPKLEDALFNWWQAVQPREPTGKELKNKSIELWQTIPACQGKETPSFSDGWLTKWRNRHGITQLKAPSAHACNILSIFAQNRGFDGMLPLSLPTFTGAFLAYPQPRENTAVDTAINEHSSPNPSLNCQEWYTRPKIEQTPSRKRNTPDGEDIDSILGSYNDNSQRLNRKCTQSNQVPRKPNSPLGQSFKQYQCLEAEVKSPCGVDASFIAFSPKLWDKIREFSSFCSTQTVEDAFMPAKTVLDIFEPILTAGKARYSPRTRDSVERSERWETCRMVKQESRTASRRAIGALRSSELFRVLRPRYEPEVVVLEE